MGSPMFGVLRRFQETNRGILGCKLGADGDADVDELLSTPIEAFSGNTLETLIRDLYRKDRDYQILKHEVARLRAEIDRVERQGQKQGKLVRWCAKRIRRMLRRQAKGGHDG